jgi:hypothetical protein
MRSWHKSHYGAWHLYGHTHGVTPPYGKSFDVGVDSEYSNFTPLHIDQVREIINSFPDKKPKDYRERE